MKRNMKQWAADTIANPAKQPIPLLSFPCIQLLNVTVKELISDSTLQSQGVKAVADRIPSGAAVSFMDLSVEAEAFGSSVRVSDNEVPTVVGALVTDADEAETLQIPAVGTARTGLYIEAIRQAATTGLLLVTGDFTATFTPELVIAPLNGGFAVYCIYLLIPIAMHVKEAIVWHISISRS